MRIPPKPQPEPGEWQIEKNHFGGVKRYRMVGNVKEYEREINGVPESIFFASQKAQKEYDEARREEERREAERREALRRNCPLRNGSTTDCTREECALFIGNGCALARLTDRPPAKDTVGLLCPLSRVHSKCRKDCTLYNGGCALTGIDTKMESEV